MNSTNKERGQERTAQAQRRLEDIRAKAVQNGTRLNNTTDRLKAAYFLTRAWQRTKKMGVSKADFENRVLAQLQRRREGREEFRLARWLLSKVTMREMEATGGDVPHGLRETWRNRPEPQKALEPYIAAVGEAALICGEMPKDWQIELLSSLSLWQQHGGEDEDCTDIPAENLALMVNALCRKLGQSNDLPGLIRRMGELPSSRCMEDDSFHPARNNNIWLTSPVFPQWNNGVYAEEVFPFPSLSLVHVRHGSAKFMAKLAPDVTGLKSALAEPVEATVYRDIRLAVAPINPRECGGVFETRGAFTLKRLTESEVEYPVLGILQFYMFICPGPRQYIEIEGKRHVVEVTEEIEGEPKVDWSFDEFEPFPLKDGPYPLPQDCSHYWSHTPVTPGYLRYWLGGGHGKPGSRDVAFEKGVPLEWPWIMSNSQPVEPPSPDRLNFWEQGPLRFLEEALHDGRAEGVLQAAFDRLTANVKAREKHWHDGREESTQVLLNRWRVPADMTMKQP